MRLSLKRFVLVMLLCLPFGALAAEPQPVLLWPDGAPGSEGRTAPETTRMTAAGEHVVSSVHHPAIIPYLPDAAAATGAAVIVIPGGGHSDLWMDHEGANVARWLQSRGIAAFVLKYRLAREKGSTYTIEGHALADTQRAIRLLRSRAAAFRIAPDRIGVAGFSAGGELAALAGTRFDEGQANAPDIIERASSRPSFMGLIYPAIPAQMPLSADTPPAFMACGERDRATISEDLPKLYLRFKAAGVSAELHVFAAVGHGFGIRPNMPASVAVWPSLFVTWLSSRGLLAPG